MKITAYNQHYVGSFSRALVCFVTTNLLVAIEPTSLCNQAQPRHREREALAESNVPFICMRCQRLGSVFAPNTVASKGQMDKTACARSRMQKSDKPPWILWKMVGGRALRYIFVLILR